MRVQDTGDGALYVQMLGGFAVTYKGKLVAGGSKASNSQFTQLLQILLHDRARGVSRHRLEQLLFEERDMEDIHHALQSVIYNSKKKLEKAGLPAGSFIEQKKGVFYWTDRFRIVEDTEQFERLVAQADKEEDEDSKLVLLLEACHWYEGEFLPSQTAVIWAAQEARRLKEIFCRAAEDAVDLLRRRQDFFQMEELGLWAARIDPLSDWETVTMEALVSLGRFEEARKLYDETVEYYFSEQGLRPSKKMLEQFERLGSEMMYRHAALDFIQSELTGRHEMYPGGYLCSYPVFQGIYRMVERMSERGGQSVYLMLCTVVDGKGNPITEGSQIAELTTRMGDAVRGAVRRGDAMCRYGRGQFLVLLMNTTWENCGVIQRRINQRFTKGRSRIGIKYYVNSVFWAPDIDTVDETARRPEGGAEDAARRTP